MEVRGANWRAERISWWMVQGDMNTTGPNEILAQMVKDGIN
jgi:hypothetical protein